MMFVLTKQVLHPGGWGLNNHPGSSDLRQIKLREKRWMPRTF